MWVIGEDSLINLDRVRSLAFERTPEPGFSWEIRANFSDKHWAVLAYAGTLEEAEEIMRYLTSLVGAERPRPSRAFATYLKEKWAEQGKAR